MRVVTVLAGLLAAVSLTASTLQRLDLNEMILKSTEIVRGKVLDSRTAMRGSVVYTLVRVGVEERWKGPRAKEVEVAIPGGAYQALRQTFSGAPTLEAGKDYVLFLWTGASGVTQVIGLSQGVFEIATNADGQLVVRRSASDAVMLDAGGSQVEDKAVVLPLSELRGRVERAGAGQ